MEEYEFNMKLAAQRSKLIGSYKAKAEATKTEQIFNSLINHLASHAIYSLDTGKHLSLKINLVQKQSKTRKIYS